MHPAKDRNFDTRISIFHLDLPTPLRQTTVGKVYRSTPCFLPDCSLSGVTIRRTNIESLTIAVTDLQGFHAGKESKNN